MNIELLKTGKAPKIVVFGDFCLDKYLYVDENRDEPSIETGLTAYQVPRKKVYAGAAGTVVNNLRALGAEVFAVGLMGIDGEGFELWSCLQDVGAEIKYMIPLRDRCTCTYTKPMRNGVEMNRFDFRNYTPTPNEVERSLLGNLKYAIRTECADAVLICDQFSEPDCGVVTKFVREQLATIADLYEKVVFYADSRAFVDGFRNVCVKCNHHEIARIFGVDSERVTPESVEPFARDLYVKTNRTIFVTFGEKGSVVYDGQTCVPVPAYPVAPPIDICGAGDACNAGIVFSLAKGLDPRSAAQVGNLCSSIAIRQIGVTGTAPISEVLEKLEADTLQS